MPPRTNPFAPAARAIAVIAGVCAVLLAIAVTNNALREKDGSAPNDQESTPPTGFFSAEQLTELTSVPIEHQAGRRLHYLNLSNDGSVTFGICQDEKQLMHFTATTTSAAKTRTTTEPCFGGFEFSDALKALVTDLAARPGLQDVDVEIDSRTGQRLPVPGPAANSAGCADHR